MITKQYFILLLMFALGLPVFADITFDTPGSSGAQSSVNNFSFSYTVGVGNNRVMYVAVNTGGTGNMGTSSLSYHGVPLSFVSFVQESGDSNQVDWWCLVAPDTGSNTLQVNLAHSPAHSSAVVYSLSGATQTDCTLPDAKPTGTNATSLAITTTVDKCAVLDDVGFNAGDNGNTGTFSSFGAGQTQGMNVSRGVSSYGAVLVSPAGAFTFSETFSGFAQGAHSAISVAPAAASGGGFTAKGTIQVVGGVTIK